MEEEGKGLGPGRQGEHWLGPRPGLGRGLRGVQSWGYRKRGEAEVGTELKRGGGSKSWACQGQESDQVKEWSTCWEVGNRVHTDDARSIR